MPLLMLPFRIIVSLIIFLFSTVAFTAGLISILAWALIIATMVFIVLRWRRPPPE